MKSNMNNITRMNWKEGKCWEWIYRMRNKNFRRKCVLKDRNTHLSLKINSTLLNNCASKSGRSEGSLISLKITPMQKIRRSNYLCRKIAYFHKNFKDQVSQLPVDSVIRDTMKSLTLIKLLKEDDLVSDFML